VAHELGMDVDEVLGWKISKVKGWLTFLRVKSDLENEVYNNSKHQAAVESEHVAKMVARKNGITTKDVDLDADHDHNGAGGF